MQSENFLVNIFLPSSFSYMFSCRTSLETRIDKWIRFDLLKLHWKICTAKMFTAKFMDSNRISFSLPQNNNFWGFVESISGMQWHESLLPLHNWVNYHKRKICWLNWSLPDVVGCLIALNKFAFSRSTKPRTFWLKCLSSLGACGRTLPTMQKTTQMKLSSGLMRRLVECCTCFEVDLLKLASKTNF